MIEELEVQIAAINRASEEIRRVANDIKALDRQAANLGGTIDTRANRSLRQFDQLLGVAGINTGRFGTAIIGAEAGTAAFGLAAVGGAAAAGAIAIGLQQSISAAIEFEDTFADIKKTVDATDAEFAELEDINRALARELPVTVKEINALGAVAGQLGIQGVDAIAEFERTVALTLITTNLAAEEAAAAFGTILNVAQEPIEHVDNLASTVNELSNQFNSTERDILAFSTRLAGAGETVGLTVGEIAAIGSTFASVGVEAERGGTAIQKVLFTIFEATEASDITDELKLLALTARTSIEEFRRLGRAEQFTRFVEGLDAINKSGGSAIDVLKALGLEDQRLIASFLSAASAGDELRRQLDVQTEAWEDNNSIQQEAEKRMATTASQMQLLKNDINDLKIEIGTALLPVTNDFIEGLRIIIETSRDTDDALGEARDAFVQLEDPILQVVDAIQGIALAAGSTHGPIATMIGLLASIPDIDFDRVGDFFGGRFGIGSSGGGEDEPELFVEPPRARSDVQAALDLIRADAELSKRLADLQVGSGTGPGDEGFGQNFFEIGEIIGPVVEAVQKERGVTTDGSGNLVWDEQDLADINAQLDAMLGGGADAAKKTAREMTRLERVMQAVSDGTITLSEATMLRLTDEEVVTLELAAAHNEAANAAFRERIELQTLAVAFAGVEPEQVQFVLALEAIAEELRESGRTVAEFRLAEELRPELNALQQAIADVLGVSTRESAQLELQRAQLERRRLLILQGGTSEDDPRIEAIDSELRGLDNLIRLRQTEVEIMRLEATLADQALITDADQVQQAHLLTEAIRLTSAELKTMQDVVFLETWAMLNAGVAANELAEQLRIAADAVASVPSYDVGGPIMRDGLIMAHAGEEVLTPSDAALWRAGMGPDGGGGGNVTYEAHVNVTVAGDATDATVAKMRREIREELDMWMREADFRGWTGPSGGGIPHA